MGNIIDYVDWRGDLTFEQDGFNQVDAVIFSQIAMIELDDFFKEYSKLTIFEIYNLMKHNGIKKYQYMGLIIPTDIIKLITKMAHSKRYKNLEVSHYVNIIDNNKQMQFCALTVKINDRLSCISFSGTDDTIIGWKENFNLVCMENIPAQLEAVKYVELIAKDVDELIICGHSKGGNLTIYSTYEINDETFQKVKKAYSIDGHGLTHKPTNEDNLEKRTKVIVSIIPQFAVVGRLFEHNERIKVIHSNAIGFYQHDTFSWEVLGRRFVVDKHGLDPDAVYIEKKVKNVIEDLDYTDKEQFVNILFSLLAAAKVEKLTDLNRKTILLIKSYMNLDPTSQKKISKVTLKLIKDKIILKYIYVNVKEFKKIKEKNKKIIKEISEYEGELYG